MWVGLVVHREWVFNKQNIYHGNDTAATHCAKWLLQVICGGHRKIAICELHNTAFNGTRSTWEGLGSVQKSASIANYQIVTGEVEKEQYVLYHSGLNFKASALQKINRDELQI